MALGAFHPEDQSRAAIDAKLQLRLAERLTRRASGASRIEMAEEKDKDDVRRQGGSNWWKLRDASCNLVCPYSLAGKGLAASFRPASRHADRIVHLPIGCTSR